MNFLILICGTFMLNLTVVSLCPSSPPFFLPLCLGWSHTVLHWPSSLTWLSKRGSWFVLHWPASSLRFCLAEGAVVQGDQFISLCSDFPSFSTESLCERFSIPGKMRELVPSCHVPWSKIPISPLPPGISFYGCCDNVAHTGWLNTTEMNYISPLETVSMKWRS